MHTNEYALETIARARLEELPLGDAVRWLRGRLRSRDGVLSPSATSA